MLAAAASASAALSTTTGHFSNDSMIQSSNQAQEIPSINILSLSLTSHAS